MIARRFSQLDVFTDQPLRGNPLAVVHDAQGLSDGQMADFARWTNLSETTFLLPPDDTGADYRVRIFTPGGELPFAGHPTLGSCHAWLSAGGVPRDADVVVQQCGVGLVRVRRDRHGDSERLAFAAPALRRTGPVDAGLRAQAVAALGLDDAELLQLQWIDNGPGWMAGLLKDAAAAAASKGARPDAIAPIRPKCADITVNAALRYLTASSGFWNCASADRLVNETRVAIDASSKRFMRISNKRRAGG